MQRRIFMALPGLVALAGLGLADSAIAAEKTVVVGGDISQTGRYSEPAGRMHNSVKLYIKQLNERGGLLGHKVDLKMMDDKSDNQTSIKLYEKLITDDKVDLLLAPYSSSITDDVANITERYKMPIVAMTSALLDVRHPLPSGMGIVF